MTLSCGTQQMFHSNRQAAQTFASRMKHCISNRRVGAHIAQLANAFHANRAGDR